MSPALLASLVAVLGMAVAAQSAVMVVLWRRVKALMTPGSKPANEPPANPPSPARFESGRRLDDLAARHRAVEERLDRVEGALTARDATGPIRPHPAGPRKARRADPAGLPLISVPNLASPASSSEEAAAELDRRFGAVWALAEAGAPVEVVARESGYPIGQVELILGLRRQLLAAEGGPLTLNPFETDRDGLGRQPAVIACLERTRSAVLNVLVGVGGGIAVSGVILGHHDIEVAPPWGVARTLRVAMGGLLVLIALAYLILRVGSGRDALRDPASRASRFFRARVTAAILGALAVPLGFASGWFTDPRLEALAPFWVAALGLGFLALPRGHELDDFDDSLPDPG